MGLPVLTDALQNHVHCYSKVDQLHRFVERNRQCWDSRKVYIGSERAARTDLATERAVAGIEAYLKTPAMDAMITMAHFSRFV